jgi:PAS domain S-box-containing protein
MRLSLRKKAFLCFFVFELSFLIIFGNMLVVEHQAEEARLRRENAERIIAKTQMLAVSVQTAGEAIAEFCRTRRPGHLRKFDDATLNIKSISGELRKEFSGDPVQREIFGQLDNTCTQMLAELAGTRQAVEQMSIMDALPVIMEARERVQPRIHELVEDGLKLIEQQKAIANGSPEMDRRQRESSHAMIVGGLLASSVLAILTLLLFLHDVVHRVRRMEDNSQRLAKDKPLLARLRGNDELAHLDGVFHDLVASLKETELVQRNQTAKILESEKRIRAILEGLNEPVIVLDSDGRIVFTNETSGKLFGYQNERLRGLPVATVLPAITGGMLNGCPQDAVSEKNKRFIETTAKREDGSEFQLRVLLSECACGGILWLKTRESEVVSDSVPLSDLMNSIRV